MAMPESKERRKQLVREYKERKKQIGVYAIRNKVTGRIFLDRALNLDVAYNKHKFQLQIGSHRNKEMQKDWNRYGEDNFSYEVIERLEDDSDDPMQVDRDLTELKELCREKLAGTPEVKGFY